MPGIRNKPLKSVIHKDVLKETLGPRIMNIYE